MAIKLPDGRIMRTLPEQVDKNMQDIASINNEVNVIKESITTAYKIQGSATVADLNANTPDAAMNGYVYNMTDAGSLINSDESTTSVQIGDNVVLVWNDGNYFWDRLSGVVDTSNLVTLDTEQEITGPKSFSVDNYIDFKGLNYNARLKNADNRFTITYANSNKFQVGNSDATFYVELRPDTTNARDIGDSTHAWKDLYLLGNTIYYNSNSNITWSIRQNQYSNLEFGYNNIGLFSIGTPGFFPNSSGARDLGTSGLRWRNLYLSGNLSDGTNSVTVAEIIKKRTTITISHAPSTTGFNTRTVALTAEQLAALDTSKALILANHYPDIALAAFISGSNLQVYIYEQGSTACEFDIFQ